jgi:hypothetical protein
MPAFAGMSGDWFAAFPHPLIPAKAGIQLAFRCPCRAKRNAGLFVPTARRAPDFAALNPATVARPSFRPRRQRRREPETRIIMLSMMLERAAHVQQTTLRRIPSLC